MSAAVIEVGRMILGSSGATCGLRDEIAALAGDRLRSVLVLGETGVGKDLVPRALARCSAHLRDEVEVFNCPAVPADHLESELFGTTRGAYPGAVDRPGAAERARGAVLFLDEVAAMPLVHQSKVLRLLEGGEGRRLGAARSYRTDAVVVAATNEDLGHLVRQRVFREDLYYRLIQDAVIQLAPLRERPDDIPPLAARFLEEAGVARPLGPEALATLRAYTWPGNVRELRAVVRGAARLARGGSVGRAELSRALARITAPDVGGVAPAGGPEAPPPAVPFYSLGSRDRRRLLVEAYQAAGGNQTLAGMLLGLHRPRHGHDVHPDLRARKLAHRKFRYWWGRLVEDAADVPGASAAVTGS